MGLELEEMIKLRKLGEDASDLLIYMIDKDLPEGKEDITFKEILKQIRGIFPPLADAYMLMYNYARLYDLDGNL